MARFTERGGPTTRASVRATLSAGRERMKRKASLQRTPCLCLLILALGPGCNARDLAFANGDAGSGDAIAEAANGDGSGEDRSSDSSGTITFQVDGKTLVLPAQSMCTVVTRISTRPMAPMRSSSAYSSKGSATILARTPCHIFSFNIRALRRAMPPPLRDLTALRPISSCLRVPVPNTRSMLRGAVADSARSL